MRAEPIVRRGWWALALWAGSLLPMARADEPPAKPATAPAASAKPEADARPADPASALERGLDFERKRNWTAAIRLYEESLERWPSRSDLAHRLRLCEMHFRLVRRYQDRSFREVLLRMPRDRAMELLEELLDRIESHYVEPVALDPIVRRGLDNIEVGLRDATFLKLNAPAADPARVAWLRKELCRRRDALDVPSRQSARAEVTAACDLARAGLGMEAAPVVLEFVYGACDVLDPYSTYLSPDKLEDMFTMIDGNFVGLGVELKADEKGLRIVGVIKGGPASDAGLKAGDRIVAIDGKPTRGLGLDESAGLLQGPSGSTVEVHVLRGDGPTYAYRLARRQVEVASVSQAKIVDRASGIGYVQLTGFQKTTADELDRAIAGLQRQGMRSLVLDLRGNPGGLLNVAVEIADRFVDRGVIVSTRGRAPGQTQTYRARAEVAYAMPVTVLIDRDSASASEILAGALKDLNRAVVVGDRSYGKGSVQSIYELRTINAGLKLTTAQFYSPLGRPYSEQGVEPDTVVRSSSKPSIDRLGDEEDAKPAFEVGDPEQDPALKVAIQQAHQRKALTAR